MFQNVNNDILGNLDNSLDNSLIVDFLLVKRKNETIIEYSLERYQNPISVAKWKNQITKVLLEELWSSLPAIEEIEKEIGELCDRLLHN